MHLSCSSILLNHAGSCSTDLNLFPVDPRHRFAVSATTCSRQSETAFVPVAEKQLQILERRRTHALILVAQLLAYQPYLGTATLAHSNPNSPIPLQNPSFYKLFSAPEHSVTFLPMF